MKERPILFSAPMVRAILAGRKTMTRRVVKPPFEIICNAGYLTRPDGHGGRFGPYPCPYGQPGDRLWVRETFKATSSPSPTVIYRADRTDWIPDAGWRPSIFMPRWASRITLEVTAVRVERLQEITEGDARAEGMTGMVIPDVKSGFRILWDSLNAERPGCSWAENPFCWVVEFKKLKVGAK